MEISFADAGTEDIFFGQNTKAARRTLASGFHSIAKRKLVYMFEAMKLDDLRQPPGNKLEKLKGDLKDFYSIRINDQFRIIFRFERFMFTEVSIIDYH